jgi:DNA-binding transcriptional MocR family regulator
MKSELTTEDPFYQQIAERVEGLIAAGTFRSGDRLPSVRTLSRDWRVSVTTAIGAYSLLEDRGIVEPRARSGYYVRARRIAPELLPHRVEVESDPVEVSCAAITEKVMDAASQRGVVPFGAAVPGDELLPTAKLTSLYGSVIRSAGASAFQYSMPPGLPELRVELAKRLLGAGIVVSPDEIITTSGALDAVLLAVTATCKAGDVIAVESPTYFGILSMVMELGLKVVEIPVAPGHGVCAGALAEAFAAHPVKACILQPNFQNPVGSVMPDGEKRRIVALAKKHGVTLIEDDLYGDLHFSEKRPVSLKAFDTGSTVIHCGSYSKSLAPGLRVGWIVPGAPHYHRIKSLKYATSLANPTASEMVVAEFLKSGGVERHFRKVRRLYARQTFEIREAILERFPGDIRVTDPAGGFLLWCQMPEGFDSEAFALAALKRKISVVPGTLFSASCGLRNCFRISCGSPLDDASRRALGILAKLAGG